MGMYDTYGDMSEQLKAGECLLNHYNVGDRVSIKDGIYFGTERAIIVKEKVLIAVISLSEVYDLYGDPLEYIKTGT